MTYLHALILFIAAVIGGTQNAVSGGGSFITFPVLIFVGVPVISANATSALALLIGSAASIGAYRHELVQQRRSFLLLMVITSLIGGALGALLLLNTPASTFQSLIPYLLLVATLLFTFSGPITAKMRVRDVGKTQLSVPAFIGLAIAQLVIATYGGYFGGGIGILMLAALAVMGMSNIHAMNGIKALLATCINGIAVLIFIGAKAISWPEAIIMIIGALLGGFGGAYYARKISPKIVRGFVIVVALTMTIYFFVTTYFMHH